MFPQVDNCIKYMTPFAESDKLKVNQRLLMIKQYITAQAMDITNDIYYFTPIYIDSIANSLKNMFKFIFYYT